MTDELSIFDAAAGAPEQIAIKTADQSFSFAACARLISDAAAPELVDSNDSAESTQAPMAIVATPSVETVLAVYRALAARRPIALIHHKLPGEEAERQKRVAEQALLPAGSAAVLFTSGSTGAARGVVLSRAGLVAAAGASA